MAAQQRKQGGAVVGGVCRGVGARREREGPRWRGRSRTAWVADGVGVGSGAADGFGVGSGARATATVAGQPCGVEEVGVVGGNWR